MKIIKLGSIVTDLATGLTGMVTHAQVEMDNRLFYGFQPQGLNPEDGQPVTATWIVAERVKEIVESVDADLPVNVLGTDVRDRASGFSGKAVSLTYHISGCVHIDIQPAGRNPKTGAMIERCGFDIRRLEGASIPVLSEKARERDQRRRPSPVAIASFRPRV